MSDFLEDTDGAKPVSSTDEVREGAVGWDVYPADESADGVDLSLIRWTLSLTPKQRLDVLEDFVETVEALRDEN